METLKVDITELPEKVASFLEADAPIQITRRGDTIGYFLPSRRKRTAADRAAFEAAAARFDAMLAETGLTEDELVREFQSLRAGKKA